MQKGEYEVEFSQHATFQAESRNVPADLLEHVVQTGTFHRFAKDMLKISKTCDDRIITCVGQIKGRWIKIITVTCSERGKP